MEVTEKIENAAKEIRAAGEMLKIAVNQLEDWLGKMPGRGNAIFRAPSTGQTNYPYLWFLFKKEKQWRLLYAPGDAHGNKEEWRYLTESSLKVKIAFVDHLPTLLFAILDSQTAMATEVILAAAKINNFMAEHKRAPEKEKELPIQEFTKEVFNDV